MTKCRVCRYTSNVFQIHKIQRDESELAQCGLHQAVVTCFISNNEIIQEFTYTSSIACTATRYGLDISPVQTGPGAHLASSTMGNRDHSRV
jgi:hypothetical protein